MKGAVAVVGGVDIKASVCVCAHVFVVGLMADMTTRRPRPGYLFISLSASPPTKAIDPSIHRDRIIC